MKKIIIFGTALRGSEIFAILKQLPQYKAVAFSCNNEAEWGSKKEGLEILPPAEMARCYPDAAVVIASVTYAEIKKDLIVRNYLPHSGCVSIQDLIRSSSKEIQERLKKSVQRQTCFYNFDYNETVVSSDSDNIDKYLVICNGGYPMEGNPRCMFAHKRVLHYIRAGVQVEAFGLVVDAPFEQYEYEGVQVFQGGIQELTYILQKRSYKKLLIHFIDANVLYAIEKADKMGMSMIVWCHGYEALAWSYAWWDYTKEEIQKNERNWNWRDKEKQKFLQNCFAMKNLHFIFVSDWMKNRVCKFARQNLKNYSIIPNYIDFNFFKSDNKTAEDRLHILSIRSHGSRKYANDLTAKAILELSERDWFSQVTFELYGKGDLLEENFGELLKCDFPNVHIHRNFLSHAQMREIFQKNGVFLAPTRSDAQGVVANEAMAAGLAVISSNIGAIPEFMDYSSACLFESDNYWMMAEEIEYLYFHPDEFLQISQNAIQRVSRQCGYENTIEKELHLILDGTQNNVS